MKRLYLILLCVCYVTHLASQEISERVYFGPEKAVVGGEFVDAMLQDTLKQSFRIRDFMDGKRHIILDFWFLDCKWCLAALPELRLIHEQHNDKFIVISINTDPHLYSFRMGTRVKNIDWISLWDEGSFDGLQSKYDFLGGPNFVLISPDGKIERTSVGYGKYPDMLRKGLLRDYFEQPSTYSQFMEN